MASAKLHRSFAVALLKLSLSFALIKAVGWQVWLASHDPRGQQASWCRLRAQLGVSISGHRKPPPACCMGDSVRELSRLCKLAAA